jgi:hypothetical protein
VLKAFRFPNVTPICITLFLLTLFLASTMPVGAAEKPDLANSLRWEDDSGETLFTANDIVRFDWERQVFELQRERAMDLMLALVPHRHLQRGFSVRDTGGEIYGGRFFSSASSQSYDGPVMLTSLTGMDEAPPLFAIKGGYPGTIGGDGGQKRFNQRLHDDLEKAGLLKTISPTDKPQPIERIHTDWCGDRDQYRMRAEIFPETFRIGQTARVHLFFTQGPTRPPTFDTVELQSTLSQTNGFFCTTDHSLPAKLTRKTVQSGFHLLRWKPWGPIFGASEITAKAGAATLSFEMILRKQTTNGLEVVCTASIPPQKLTVLP